MRVLVTGGAGYVGSFVVRALLRAGHEPIVVDDLSRGHIASLPGLPVIRENCGDRPRMTRVMERLGIDAVIHLAARSLVGESVAEPLLYWRENVGQAAGLLEACRAAGVRRFVFSSSAAVYGEPRQVPIAESHELAPTNPYGATKRAIEEMLAGCERAFGLAWTSLRYFNAAGAAPDGSAGEDHPHETHLIPLALAAAAGQSAPLVLFGDDHGTPDGTCIRDYVHVLDLAEAHVLALERLPHDAPCGGALNLGAGRGTSVRELLAGIARVTGRPVPHRVGPRREGDPAVLVADIARARRRLGWRPRRSSLDRILGDAWRWHAGRPGGYAKVG